MLEEFKKFILRGNVLDLAVAVIMGDAFGKIVSSLVQNIITPLLGVFLGGVDFRGLSYTIGDSVITYGEFIQSIVDFLIIAAAIFVFLKFIKKISNNFVPPENKPKPEPAPVPENKAEQKPNPTPNPTEEYLKEIRDLLLEHNKAEG